MINNILSDSDIYKKMSIASNIYGTGDASKKISDIITRLLNL